MYPRRGSLSKNKTLLARGGTMGVGGCVFALEGSVFPGADRKERSEEQTRLSRTQTHPLQRPVLTPQGPNGWDVTVRPSGRVVQAYF